MPSTVLEARQSVLARNQHALFVCVLIFSVLAIQAHDVAATDALFLSRLEGPAPVPYAYLGAKHMVTGVDHVLYLAGVIFFLTRLRDVVVYVSLFTLGHSVTLILGTTLNWQVNAFLIDAIIGLSVAYKAMENIGGLALIKLRVDTRLAVLGFGLCHGLGLATKLQDLIRSQESALVNLVSFNLGVELGQLLALTLLYCLLATFRREITQPNVSLFVNSLILIAGLTLFGYHLVGMLTVQ